MYDLRLRVLKSARSTHGELFVEIAGWDFCCWTFVNWQWPVVGTTVQPCRQHSEPFVFRISTPIVQWFRRILVLGDSRFRRNQGRSGDMSRHLQYEPPKSGRTLNAFGFSRYHWSTATRHTHIIWNYWLIWTSEKKIKLRKKWKYV